jgi:hypothetical protein
MKSDKADFPSTYRKYGGPEEPMILDSRPVAPEQKTTSTATPPHRLLSLVVQHYHQIFLEDRRGVDYLTSRGIHDTDALVANATSVANATFKTFQIGLVTGSLKKILPTDPTHETNQGLKALGLLNEKGNEFFYNCIVFPITDDNGAIVGVYGRGTSSLSAKHLYLPGPHKGVWNSAAFKAHKDIFLTESIIDALSLYSLGFKNVVPLYGTNGFTKDHERLLQEHRTQKVYLCLDNDPAGTQAATTLTARLTPLGIHVRTITVPHGAKDINESLQKGLTADDIQKLLRLAEPTANIPDDNHRSPPENHTPTLPADRADGSPTIDVKDDGVHMGFKTRRYRLRGLSPKMTDHLRVNIKVDTTESGGTMSSGTMSPSHLDTFDLYSAKSRATFVAHTRKIIPAEEGELLAELNQIVDECEKLQALGTLKGGDSSDENQQTSLAPTPEQEAEALTALKSPTLWTDILSDMDALGPVGEEHNKGLVYLVGTSRLLEEPLSCSIISQSAAGKSVLAETVEKMMPPESVKSYARITQNGLFYVEENGLVHALLIVEERSGAEAADYSIRALQSKKKLIQAVPMKDPATGKILTKTLTVHGPIAYMETTTQPRLHEENATRCFEIYLNQTPDQTKLIHRRQKDTKTLDGLKKKEIAEHLKTKHHTMQRLLNPLKVVIPYVHDIHFPANWLRTRRDHQRFLNLIEVVTFLHQHQRETKTTDDGLTYIEATLNDYTIAYTLAQSVMGESLTELKPPQREVLEAGQKLQNQKTDFTRRDIRETTGLPHRRCWELLEDLVDLEYLTKVTGQQGQTCRYRLADNALSALKPLDGLTTVEELAKATGACG